MQLNKSSSQPVTETRIRYQTVSQGICTFLNRQADTNKLWITWSEDKEQTVNDATGWNKAGKDTGKHSWGKKKVIVLSHYTVIASCTLQCVIKWSSADFPEQTGDYFILRLLFPKVWWGNHSTAQCHQKAKASHYPPLLATREKQGKIQREWESKSFRDSLPLNSFFAIRTLKKGFIRSLLQLYLKPAMWKFALKRELRTIPFKM